MTDFRLIVEQLFGRLRRRRGQLCINPVTGEGWVCGHDRLKPHKERAMRALAAQAYFAWDVQEYAPEALPLPVNEEAIFHLKMQSGLPYLVAVYAQSLQARDWETSGHANFSQYACCVMGSWRAPDQVRNDPVLQTLFPPYPNDLLGPGLTWPVKSN